MIRSPQPIPTRRSPRATLLVLAAALLLGGCDTDVTPVTGTEMPFTMYGVLTPQRGVQSVFVFSIEGSLEPTPPAPLAATLTSTDLETGAVQVWRDSLVQDERGFYAHAYVSPFTAQYGRAYRLVVERSDGASSRAAVTVPPQTDLVLPPRQDNPPSFLNVEIIGNAPNLIRIEVVYEYKYITAAGIERTNSVVSYEGRAEQTTSGWLIPVNTASDLGMLRRALEERVFIDPGVGLKVVKITVRLIVANAAWMPPGGAFEPEVLVQPGTMSNVENGLGFVGAGYRHEDVWIPLDTLITVDTGPDR